MPLRFTIRDLFWLTLVAALAVGWWLDASRRSEELDALKSQLRPANAQQAVRRNLEWLAQHSQP